MKIEQNEESHINRLVALGGDVNTKDNKGHRPHLFKPSARLIKYSIENGADINGTDSWQDTYLCEAIEINDLEVARFLITHGIDINKGCHFNNPALIKAIKKDNFSFVKLLIDRGANKDVRGQASKSVMENARKGGNKLLNTFSNV